jgi:DNA-binding transcriptional LysR family regulator
LLETQEVCILPDGHPLLKKAAIDLTAFTGQAFVNLSAQDPYRLAIENIFEQSGIGTERQESDSSRPTDVIT